MLDIIIENKKIVTILFIIAFIIILAVFWLPQKDIELSHYKEMALEEMDTKAIKQYGDELQFAMYSRDLEFLKDKISPEYLEYTGLTIKDYKEWLLRNNLLTTNIKFAKTTKYQYGDTNIYSIDAVFDGKNQTINIIETYPEKWNFTLDTFIAFNTTAIKKEANGYGAIINSIYHDVNYIEFDVSVYVDEAKANNIDISKSDSVRLVMEDKSSFIMATNDYNSETTLINQKEYMNIKCIFNIPISKQDKIEYIVFDSYNISGNEKSIKIDLDL